MRKVVRFSWYGDCTLEGNDVTLYRDSHIEIYDVDNNFVELELPLADPVNRLSKQNVLQLVCKRWRGQILIAGQGHKDDQNWLYKDGRWRAISASFGTFSCAFDSNHLYLVVGSNQYRVYDLETDKISETIPREIGVNGIHYIDFHQSSDGIVTGDSVYYSPEFKLSEYTRRNEIVIGQSHNDNLDNCIAVYHKRYRIEDGNCKFIRFYRKDDKLAIAIVKQQENSAVFYWLTIDELVNGWIDNGERKFFPIAKDLLEEPKDPEVPEIPSEKPMTLQAPNLIESVKRMMRVHTEVNLLNEEDRAKILDYVIKAENKPQLGRKARNADGSNKNTDALTWKRTDNKFEIYDVINGSDPNKDNPDRGKFATWDLGISPTNSTGIWNPGENGYWAPGGEVEDGHTVPEKPPVEKPPVTEKVFSPRISYDEMSAFIVKVNAANRETKFGKSDPIIAGRDLFPIQTAAHILWRYFFQHDEFSDEKLILEVIERGNAE